MQLQLPILLTELQLATSDQLVSYRIGKKKNESDESVNARIEVMISSPKFIDEVIRKCEKWNDARGKLNLKEW